MWNWSVITAACREISAQSNLDIGVTARDNTVMAFENMLSKMGSGMKHLTDRYAEYDAPPQDPHLLYSYEPAMQTHEVNSKHNYGGGGSKNNAAMSALTLLAFLFFLHILQQCIKEHMATMGTPQITIMTAGREGEAILKKEEKIDKAGFTPDDETMAANKDDNVAMKIDEENKYLMKVNTADPPKSGVQSYAFPKDYNDRRFAQTGFVSAMDDDFNK